MLFISGPEIAIVFIVVLLLFGSKKIPDLARGLGKGMREFKKATDDIKKEMQDNSSDIVNDFKDIQKDITKGTQDVVNNIKKGMNTD